ncbi:MAG: hypothetical protein H7311_08470 [Ramlibacter sp.]|nr:hypothetical protein [Cryobacterium sp.]
MPFPPQSLSPRPIHAQNSVPAPHRSQRPAPSRVLAASSALLALLLLAGCSTTDAPPPSPTATPTPTKSLAPTGDGILRIGTLFPMTGGTDAAAPVTGPAQVAGTELAAREILELGTAAKLPIELVHRNSMGNVGSVLAELLARHVDLLLWDATTPVPAEVTASVDMAGVTIVPLDTFANGGTPLPADDAFAARLRTADPGLTGTAGGGEAYDALMLAALAAVEAHDDGAASLGPAIDRVSHGSTVCGSWSACLTGLSSSGGISWEGMTGRRS